MATRNKITRNAKQVWRSIVKGVRFVWKQTIVYNLILVVAVLLLSRWLLAQAFTEFFNCKFLIQDSLSMPKVMCEGASFGPFGNVPGLSSAMDGPLDWIRRGGIYVVLFFAVVISAYATFIINNLKKVTRLLTFNKQEWKALLANMRIFVSILFVLIFAFFIWIR